jgi:hypothetical protein
MRNALVFSLAALLLTRTSLGEDRVAISPDLYTKAELTAFRTVETYQETITFLKKLANLSPYLRLEWFGTSGQGRRMPVVIVSKEKLFTPEERFKGTKPVVLILNSIHGGEVDGTDACLILLRDIALTNRPEILEGVTLLVVPIYNVDGFSRVSKWSRPNQDGPEDGMGFRANASGLDLNRDWLKADAPETRALLGLVNAWKPDLFIDDHVTDGSDFQATLTLSYLNEPFTPKPLAEWLKSVVPKALTDVEESGFGTGPYVELRDPLDPTKGIEAAPAAPRYSTGYFPLRAVPAILVETHAIKPYAQRVRANERFLAHLLARVGKDAKSLLSAREKARQEARHAAPGSPFTLAAETDTSRPEMIEFRTFAWTEALSPVTGMPVLRYDRTRKITLKLPNFEHVKPTLQAPRPAAYLVPAGWPAIEECLKLHGIRHERLPEARTLTVGTYRAKDPQLAAASYQGRIRVTATIVRGTETRQVPAGSLYVPLDTQLAPVAMVLLEPEGPDSLFAWGELSSALEQREYIDLRVLDPLAEEMLAKDATLRAEWEEKLKNRKFASDSRARRQFFYTRTKYWDDTIGLIPVYRLDAPLADLGPSR